MSIVLPGTQIAESAIVQVSYMRRLAPMILLQAFLWATLALFAFGPWQWPMRNPQGLFGFVALCHGSLFLGYLLVAHTRPTASPFASQPARLIRAGLICGILVIPITSYARTGRFIPDIVGSLLNPGQAYMEAHEYAAHNTNAGAYLRILLSALLVIAFPLAVYYWGRISRPMKFGVIGMAMVTVIMCVATGQRRDIADLLVTLPLILLAGHWAKVTVLSRRVVRNLVVGLLAAFALFLAYFSYSHISRVGSDTATFAVNPATQQHPDRSNWLLSAIPVEAQPGFLAFAGYLTTGYYGLSLSLDREHEPMYGFGHSMFLTRNFARFSNDDSFEQRSLPYIISEKDGFKYPVYWCTAYPYFLNDFGVWGTALVMLGLGALLALTWSDMLGGRSPYAVVMFWMLTVLIFYLPATNRMLQDGEGVFAFYIWVITYLRGRRALAPKGKP